ncbi:MAG: hypothetical protein AB7S59_19100, partial [Parvibaculaceae bacterium]
DLQHFGHMDDLGRCTADGPFRSGRQPWPHLQECGFDLVIGHPLCGRTTPRLERRQSPAAFNKKQSTVAGLVLLDFKRTAII